MNAWSIAFWILFVLFLAGIGLFIWYYLRPKCPTGQKCLSTTPPACNTGFSCQNTANPCGTGKTCTDINAKPNCSNVPTCPTCNNNGAVPMYLYGFKLNNNNYASLDKSDGVLTIDGQKVVIKTKGSANQKWVLVPNTDSSKYRIKNADTSDYIVAPELSTTVTEPLVTLTQSETTGTFFQIIPVVNRGGRTYVFRTTTADLSVKDNSDVVMSKFPATRGAENNDEWMVSLA